MDRRDLIEVIYYYGNVTVDNFNCKVMELIVSDNLVHRFHWLEPIKSCHVEYTNYYYDRTDELNISKLVEYVVPEQIKVIPAYTDTRHEPLDCSNLFD